MSSSFFFCFFFSCCFFSFFFSFFLLEEKYRYLGLIELSCMCIRYPGNYRCFFFCLLYFGIKIRYVSLEIRRVGLIRAKERSITSFNTKLEFVEVEIEILTVERDFVVIQEGKVFS